LAVMHTETLVCPNSKFLTYERAGLEAPLVSFGLDLESLVSS
jgi:hypothetical protein